MHSLRLSVLRVRELTFGSLKLFLSAIKEASSNAFCSRKVGYLHDRTKIFAKHHGEQFVVLANYLIKNISVQRQIRGRSFLLLIGL